MAVKVDLAQVGHPHQVQDPKVHLEVEVQEEEAQLAEAQVAPEADHQAAEDRKVVLVVVPAAKVDKIFYIGTSGWMYKHWNDKFYPKKLEFHQLTYFSQEFETVEINSTFYRMPQSKVFKNWQLLTPKGFVFAVKMNRLITHIKRLKLDSSTKGALKYFFKGYKKLKYKAGPVLVQLPPSAKANLERFEEFIEYLEKKFPKISFAFEFRHQSWFTDEAFNLMKKHKLCLVVADGDQNISPIIFSADFMYIRFHSPGEIFDHRYTINQLIGWQKRIKEFPAKIKKIYIYFNNDYKAHALENARSMIKLLKK